MKEWYSNIITLGASSKKYDTTTSKRVRLLNVYALTWLHIIVIFIILDYLTGIAQAKVIAAHTITGIGMFLTLFFNTREQFGLSRMVWTVFAFANLSLFGTFVQPGVFLEYYLLLVPGFVISLYDSRKVAFTSFVLSFILFLVPYYFFPSYDKSIVDRVIAPSLLGLFLCVYLLFDYFRRQNQHNEYLLALERDHVLSDKIILEKQGEELRELNEFKSHFFVNLSHEIRTPLTLIQGYTSQLENSKLKKSDLEKLKIIREQTTAMQSIVKDILDLSRMDRKEFQLHLIEVDINDFLLKPYTSFKPLFEKKGVTIEFESLLQNVTISIDQSLLEKAVSNLLSNALKFTPKDGNVKISVRPVHRGVGIQVKDSGIGIPKEEVTKLFQRFYQVKNDITRSQGSGIGLAFVKSIIDEHGFEINVESKFEEGTSFTIKIPERSVSYGTSSIEKEAVGVLGKVQSNTTFLNKAKASIVQSRKQVLVVDDHEQMRDYVKTILSDYEILEAENGKEALELVKANTLDFIVTDYMMPVMDGAVFVQDLKKLGIKIPILVLTARSDNEGKLKMLRLGVDGYLYKPFLEEELKLQVARGIQLYDNIKDFQETIPEEELSRLDRQALKFQEKIEQFIEERMGTSNLNVEEIALGLNMSRSTLNRKAKALLGQSVKELIMEARLQRVKKLLNEDPDITKTQIAQAVGVSNISYLFEKYQSRFGSRM